MSKQIIDMTKYVAYVFNVDFPSWKHFNKCDTANLIYGTIHVEKTFRVLHCQMC